MTEKKTEPAVSLMEAGRFAEAEEMLMSVVRAEPGYLEAYRLLAICFSRLGKREQALELIKAAVAQNPGMAKLNDTWEMISQGGVADASGRFDESKSRLESARALLESGAFDDAMVILNELKPAGEGLEDTDLLRARCFMHLGQREAAIEALLEELRFFPGNRSAASMLQKLKSQPEESIPPGAPAEFVELLAEIRPFTMLSTARLFSIYQNSRRICEKNLPGNFVECGVAAGGSSALICFVISKHSQRERSHFALDSFEGMPDPGEYDTIMGVSAHDAGWGKGTCSATEKSVQKIAALLGVERFLHVRKGLFSETLPRNSQEIGDIAFLHMDGDWYKSTRDILFNLYDQVVTGGVIQVDDYGHWEGCRKAIHEWETHKGVTFHLNRVDNTGVWFEKPEAPSHSGVPLSAETNSAPTRDERAMLNLACGNSFHEGWENYDLSPSSGKVKSWSASEGIDHRNQSVDVIYCSHFLEHLSQPAGEKFIRECHRVLKPGGILRIVVPDLEQIARNYLESLDGCDNDPALRERYDWTVIELLDQLVRSRSGGEMFRYWKRNPMPAEEFVLERLGEEVESFLTAYRTADRTYQEEADLPEPDFGELAQFRKSGEVHQWMYDRFSLGRLLSRCGFTAVRKCRAEESRIEGFSRWNLDVRGDGRVRKPDSLFMEAIRF